MRLHVIAATRPEISRGIVTYSSSTVFCTVLAMLNPSRYSAMKNATKLKNADQITAWVGESTLVDTTVAIELAAS